MKTREEIFHLWNSVEINGIEAFYLAARAEGINEAIECLKKLERTVKPFDNSIRGTYEELEALKERGAE